MQAKRVILGAMLASGVGAMAPAQTPPAPIRIVPPCAAPGFPGWGRRPGGAAAIWLKTVPASELSLDDTVYLSLVPIGTVPLAVPLGKPAQANDRGGLVTFHPTTAGTYRIALGGRAWIDVVRGGRAVASVAHQMGMPCSGIAKMVDFRLDPGAYTIQLSATADPTLRIAITRLP